MLNPPEAARSFAGPTAQARPTGWEILPLWILANAMCGALGIWLLRVSGLTAGSGVAGSTVALFASWILPPFLTGVLQWLVLSRLIAHSRWWIPASALGYGAGLLVFGAVVSGGIGLAGGEESPWVILPFVAGSLLFGAAAGIAQSLVLRRSVTHPALWVLVSAVGFSPAVVLFIIVTRGNDGGLAAAVAAGGASGLLYGLATGIPLVWLLRQTAARAPAG